MKQIPAHRVKKDNSNIRKYSDSLWRALRKERFKKANPEKYTNQMAAEQVWHNMVEDVDFRFDAEDFSKAYLSAREADIFALFLFGGKLGQVEIGEILGVCQATVHNDLDRVLNLFRKYYFAEHRGNHDN